MTFEKKVVFFDLDNCLYPKSYAIHDMMASRITAYFADKLGVPEDEAERLREIYYRHYGIAIRGLVLHHQIDAVDYDKRVDQSLPLEKVVKRDDRLRDMLLELRKKYKLWIFTNAYVVHATRVLTLLGISDCFHGVTYCDYDAKDLVAKPMPEMYARVMKDAGITKKENCIFFDDSYGNIVGARDFGWKYTIQVVEEDEALPEPQAGSHVIRDIHDSKEFLDSVVEKNEPEV
ncbi:pyrimidine 5'-nucleotidase [Schizosaccharomyces osmophilus]|uniref:Pyrimidine 5'-nucleotidase n=1 Tax=Schizosaccharomyces osmophilus TaxID=2545709 RepID=A0AAF0AWW2_9SCHI|nr:pyrimidine 5'-nucleotidase [Schizosaccharomyces osmophilus]WBW74147.1 pyrimidine 5'-nucleotidase [Schizosaccharomyces osmophilus]